MDVAAAYLADRGMTFLVQQPAYPYGGFAVALSQARAGAQGAAGAVFHVRRSLGHSMADARKRMSLQVSLPYYMGLALTLYLSWGLVHDRGRDRGAVDRQCGAFWL